MRSVVVTPLVPVQSAADMAGQHRRVGAFLRALGRISQSIHLVYLVPDTMLALAADPARLDASQSEVWQVRVRVTLIARRSRPQTRWTYYGAGILAAGQNAALYPYGGARIAEQVGQCLDGEPDLVFADRLDAALPILASGRTPRRLVLDVGDLYHRVLLRSSLAAASATQKALALQAPALVAAERRVIKQAAVAFVCSDADARHLRALRFPSQVRVVPNAVEIPAAPPGVVAAPSVLYLGSFYHPPNVLAVERLIARLWPRIRAQVPAARLLVAGADSERLPSRHAGSPGVEFLGFVPDIAALYAGSRLICAPITTGSGTRLKLLEAAAHARPIVSTRIGAEGLDFRDGCDILLREDDAGLAEACVALLGDDALCRTLGSAARAMVQERYDVNRIEGSIAEQLSEVCRDGAQGGPPRPDLRKARAPAA